MYCYTDNQQNKIDWLVFNANLYICIYRGIIKNQKNQQKDFLGQNVHVHCNNIMILKTSK